MGKVILIISIFFFAISSFANKDLQRREAIGLNLNEEKSAIEWLNFEEAIDKNSKDKKFIFIDIYTDWCGWCKKMDQSTFQDESVVEYMNEHFYSVKMNAEKEEGIVFKEKLYELKNYNGKTYNELAVNLLASKMSFPSFVVLSKREVKIGTISGYQKPSELISNLKRYIKK